MARVVRTDRELELPGVDAALRADGHELVLLSEGVTENELVAATADARLLLMCYTPITRRVIEGARELKAIVKYGVGIDAIDLAAARSRGVPVANVPDYAEETVAEGAFALMMALAKKLKPLQRAMDSEGWVWPTGEWLAADLAGKTAGVVGLGRIGSAFARMAAGFRMRVLSYDPYVPAATHRNLHAMLAESDFVSIHCVLNDETRHLVGEAELRAMKPGAFLINVARGAIVDESALLRSLESGRLAGAALDVYSREPLSRRGHPLSALYAMDNVILSPHLTFYTRAAMARLEAETLERCREALEGRPLEVRSRDPRLRAQTRGVRFVD
ncbi:MAG TPA: C-terminal binding protein [Burkholderiales bacterium]|nr:C-terminal binding protein [Burkholderiales bacterium]